MHADHADLSDERAIRIPPAVMVARGASSKPRHAAPAAPAELPPTATPDTVLGTRSSANDDPLKPSPWHVPSGGKGAGDAAKSMHRHQRGQAAGSARSHCRAVTSAT
jgi:hypothetical protein